MVSDSVSVRIKSLGSSAADRIRELVSLSQLV